MKLFGIKGKRWNDSDMPKRYNERLVRPSMEKVPQNHALVEGGCYG